MKQDKKILIGTKMQNIRKSLGLTQEQVAERLELAPHYVSDIERDKTKGSIDTLVKLCNIYNVSPSYILNDYINVKDTNTDDDLIGFYNLDKHDKNIIIELIRIMNQQ